MMPSLGRRSGSSGMVDRLFPLAAIVLAVSIGAARAGEDRKHILATVDPGKIANYRSRLDRLAQMRGIRQSVGHFALREARARISDADVLMRAAKPEQALEQIRAADAVASAVDLDKLRWKTAIQHRDAAGVETDDLLILMNRDMALAFDRTTLRLLGLYDPTANKEYILTSTAATARNVIGKIVVLKPYPKRMRWKEIAAGELDACSRGHRWRKTPAGIELVLSWKEIGVPSYEGLDETRMPAQPGVLAVEARVSMESEGMSRWSCRVENRSPDLGLQHIEFPVLANLQAWDEEDPVDFNAFGDPRPTDKTRLGGGFLGMMEVQDKCSDLRFGYQAYYGRRGGIYYLPEDPEYLWKECRPGTDGESRTATFSHAYFAVNHRGEEVKRFEATYPVAVGIFHGDWYTAARTYRRWAIRQPWCAKGPLAQRDDLPDWFKEREFFQQGGGGGMAGYETDQRIARKYGRPVGIWNTTWMHYGFDNRYPDYFPPKMGEEAFKQAIARGHELGLHYMPYINVNHYAFNAPSHTPEVLEAGARFVWGPERVLGMRFKYGTVDMHAMVMCPATKLWQDKVSEMVRKLIQEYDCDGIYFDTLDIYCMQCSHPDHGHPRGGGNYWVEGVREILRRARRESMAAGKKVAFSGEFWRERYIGDCDAGLWLAEYGPHYVRDVVYHDYLTTICREWHGRPVVPYLGSLFTAGQTQGPLGLGEKHLSGETVDQEVLGFLHYLSNCRREFGMKYVNLGARLRNPEIRTQLPTVDPGRDGAPLPAVITSAWEAGDGDIGCIFMNISEESQEFEFAIDLARFEVGPLATYAVTKHELGHKSSLAENNSGTLTASDILEGGKMMMIEFSPK